ncbi:hypothetical protein J6590_039249 [Homalodisca vitripennis]|nr:hypothetical protein J6590_039249 [Homalodisca vitripennis]
MFYHLARGRKKRINSSRAYCSAPVRSAIVHFIHRPFIQLLENPSVDVYRREMQETDRGRQFVRCGHQSPLFGLSEALIWRITSSYPSRSRG